MIEILEIDIEMLARHTHTHTHIPATVLMYAHNISRSFVVKPAKKKIKSKAYELGLTRYQTKHTHTHEQHFKGRHSA